MRWPAGFRALTLLVAVGACAAPGGDVATSPGSGPVTVEASWVAVSLPADSSVADVVTSPVPGLASLAPPAAVGTTDVDDDVISVRTVATPSDYVSPAAVVSAWWPVWCGLNAAAATNEHLHQARQWQTDESWAQDMRASAFSATEWDGLRRARLVRFCTNRKIEVSTQAPQAPDHLWVIVSAEQTWMSPHGPRSHQRIAQTRRVVRTSSGSWLVDVAREAG